MPRRTPLYECHLELDARMVEFAGWTLPLHFGSQIEEHHRVRRAAAMFDVSHMTIVDVSGADSRAYLRLLLATDVARLAPGRAAYGCMLNARGGVIDDLIVYCLDTERYRLVLNAATRDKDLSWLDVTAAEFDAVTVHERADLAMIAVQGPRARARVVAALGEGVGAADRLAPFGALQIGALLIARTGYTGEDGLELMLPAAAAPFTWRRLLEAGVSPAGLGARDTLRLEAGFALYGAELDEETTPLETGLAWTVSWEPPDRNFTGREALERQRREGVRRTLVGLVLEGGGVLRAGQRVACNAAAEGRITSGGYSPTLGCSIALARVPVEVAPGARCRVAMRGREVDVRVVRYPFVRHGRKRV